MLWEKKKKTDKVGFKDLKMFIWIKWKESQFLKIDFFFKVIVYFWHINIQMIPQLIFFFTIQALQHDIMKCNITQKLIMIWTISFLL